MKYTGVIIITFLLFSVELLSQDEKWINLRDTLKVKSGLRITDIYFASNEKYITYYPLNEVSLWLFTRLPISKGNFTDVMLKVRFRVRESKYIILNALTKSNEWSETDIRPFYKGFDELMAENPIKKKIWKFVSSYYDIDN